MTDLNNVLEEFLKFKKNYDEIERNGEESYSIEFMKLKDMTYFVDGEKIQTTEGEKTLNISKNRFRDILPYDYNRIKISSPDTTDYINASRINGVNTNQYYIATQGPLQKTVNDFWNMIYEFKIKVVVMACKEYEGSPPKLKSFRYWPNTMEEELKFGEFTIKMHEATQEVSSNYCIRKIQIKFGREPLRIVHQIHYTNWPDRSIPKNSQSIIDLIETIRFYHPIDRVEPLLIHCSAGCGRTGTILVLDYVRWALKTGNIKKGFNIFDLVLELRKQRMALVQTLDQYVFVYDLVCILFRNQLNLIEQNCYYDFGINSKGKANHQRHMSLDNSEEIKGNKSPKNTIKPAITVSKPVTVIVPKEQPIRNKYSYLESETQISLSSNKSDVTYTKLSNVLKEIGEAPSYLFKNYGNIAFPNRVGVPKGGREMRNVI